MLACQASRRVARILCTIALTSYVKLENLYENMVTTPILTQASAVSRAPCIHLRNSPHCDGSLICQIRFNSHPLASLFDLSILAQQKESCLVLTSSTPVSTMVPIIVLPFAWYIAFCPICIKFSRPICLSNAFYRHAYQYRRCWCSLLRWIHCANSE